MRLPTEAELIVERVTTWIGSTASLVAHTILFLGSFGIAFLGWEDWNTVLLVVTTIVSLEAIYLAIFIQMTVNRQGRAITEVSEDVEDIQEDIEEISEDVEEIQENVEELSVEDWDLENGKPRPPEAATIDQLAYDVKNILARLEALRDKKN